MALAAGARVGVYEILSALGAGGMGEVYRARDAKLNRDVAIKVLPDSFATDPERLARFQREAQVLASLNHPNIAAIYGFEHTDGLQALVLELVEGPTLADRIAQGPIPLEEALPVARQIAVALEAAHEQGIVHRDLKPANIKLRPDGTVKVLDFGLAKAMDPVGSATSVSQSPTITSPAMTRAGIILGTAAYMSPEQAAGKTADKRSDLWAFGVVLLEMLTGQPAFTGETVSHVLAGVLKSDPDWSTLPEETPPAVRRLLRRCLTKDRKRRLDSAADAQLEIDDAETAPALEAHTHATPSRVPLWRKALLAAAVIIVGLASGYAAWTLKPVDPRAITRFAIPLGEREAFTLGPGNNVALSPDGTRLAYTANNRLYLRALDNLEAVTIAGGDGPGLASPRTPFFSTDGQWVGFWQASQLQKVSVGGGAAVPLCAWKAPPYGASWADDNTILLADGPGGIWRVSGNGGTPEPIVKVDSGQRAHGPQLLPDGRSVLFTLAQTASWDEAQIVVQSLDSGSRQTLIAGGTDGRYLPTGHLVYALRDTVLAVPFDSTSLSIRGGPKPLVEGVQRHIMANTGASQFVVASDGTLAYVPAATATTPRRTFVWVDRQGREEAIAVPLRPYSRPRLAPDDTRLAVEIEHNQNWDIWVWDFQRGSLPRMTSDPSYERYPVWTPDGQHIIFTSDRSGVANLFRQAANGTGKADRLSDTRDRSNLVAFTISPDGRHLVFRGADGRGGSDLMILDLGDERGIQSPSAQFAEPRPLVQTASEEYNAEISPDGRWLAYQSNSSTAFEVYVRPLPDVESGLWQVSTAGGTEPLWARNGRELYYRAPTGAVMRVSIAPGSTWRAGTPTELFTAARYALGASGDLTSSPFRTYDVSADGRFLMMKNADGPAQPAPAPRIVVVRNWVEELKRLVPTK